jgi:hypothetical protein
VVCSKTERSAGFTDWRSSSEARFHRASVDAQCRAVDGGGERAVDTGDEAGGFLGVAERLISDEGRTVVKNSFSNCSNGLPPLSWLTNSSAPADQLPISAKI